MLKEIFIYIDQNWFFLVKCGLGGLVAAFLLVFILKGVNNRWRWSKTH